MIIMTSFGVIATLLYQEHFKQDNNLITRVKEIIKENYVYDTYNDLDSILVKGLIHELDYTMLEKCSKEEIDILNTGYIYGFGMETISKSDGFLITKVYEKSPSEDVGLKEGDTIKSINGYLIANTSDAIINNELKKETLSIILNNNKKYFLKKDLINFNSIKIIESDKVQINYFTNRTYDELKEFLIDFNKDKLTIDISYLNSGDINVLQDVLSLFLSKGTTLGTVSKQNKTMFIKTIKEQVYKNKLEVITTSETGGTGEFFYYALLVNNRLDKELDNKKEGYIYTRKYLMNEQCLLLPEYRWSTTNVEK